MRPFLVALSLFATSAGATTIASVDLDSLFSEAAVVALVEVRWGDADVCKNACLYRATVLESFKGCETGSTVYFGPYVSYGIGKKYVVFLAHHGDTVGTLECTPATASFGAAPYYRVMYSGFSVLDVEYTCDWVAHRDTPYSGCDDGVRIEYTQVVLPKSVRVEPLKCGSFRFGWVRLGTVLKALRSLQASAR